MTNYHEQVIALLSRDVVSYAGGCVWVPLPTRDPFVLSGSLPLVIGVWELDVCGRDWTSR